MLLQNFYLELFADRHSDMRKTIKRRAIVTNMKRHRERDEVFDKWLPVRVECTQEENLNEQRDRDTEQACSRSSCRLRSSIERSVIDRCLILILHQSKREKNITRIVTRFHHIHRPLQSLSNAILSLAAVFCFECMCVSGITKIEMWIYFSYWLLMTRDNNKNTAYTLLLDADTHTRTQHAISYSPPAAQLMLFFIEPIKHRALRCLYDGENRSSCLKRKWLE